jgi:hypothetical protein
MTCFSLSRRTRRFLLWTARLVLVAYIVQLSAFDHWHSHFDNLIGIEGSSAHVQHCHGAGDCSTTSDPGLSANAGPTTLPAPSGVLFGLNVTSQTTPEAAFISPPSEPPQAA